MGPVTMRGDWHGDQQTTVCVRGMETTNANVTTVPLVSGIQFNVAGISLF